MATGSTTMSLELGEPGHGWLPAKLIVGDSTWVCSASDGGNDPLAELIELMRTLATGTTVNTRVCFWLEPEAYSLDVAPARAEVDTIELEVGFSRDFFPCASKAMDESLARVTLDRGATYRMLMSVLTGFLEEHGRRLQAHWRRDGVGEYQAALEAARAAWKSARSGRANRDPAAQPTNERCRRSRPT